VKQPLETSVPPRTSAGHTNPVRVDLSLARGLRNTMIKRITATRGAMDRAANWAFTRRSSMPSTRKGFRRVYRELAKFLNRYALASNTLEDIHSEVFWHHWDIRQNVAVDNWEEDQLTVTGVVYNLLDPQCVLRRFDYPIGLSMHLVERTFQRLKTTCNETLIDQLIFPTLVACTLWPFIYWELKARNIQSQPIMIPTKAGAIVGDVFVRDGDEGMQFRTFLTVAELSPSKSRLLEALRKWEAEMRPAMWMGLQVSTFDHMSLPDNVGVPEVVEFRKYAVSYLNVLELHADALDVREARAQRAAQEYRKWTR